MTGTIASRVITYTPTFGDYERAKGFIEFENGFTCTSDPGFLDVHPAQIGVNVPVGGTIDLSHGSMQLTDDLYLGDSAQILGVALPRDSDNFGNIHLDNHTLYLYRDLTLNSGRVIFASSGVIDGLGHSLYLDGGKIMFENSVPGTITITLRNLTIYDATCSPFSGSMNDSFKHNNSVNFVFDNVTFANKQSTAPLFIWSLNTDIIRSLRFEGKGFCPALYHTNVYIHPLSQLYVGPGNDLVLWQFTNVFFADKSSILYLDTAALQPTIAYHHWIHGTIIINGSCGLVCDDSSMLLGGTTPEEDMDILFLPGSRLQLYAGGVPTNMVTMNNYDRSPFWGVFPD